MSNDFPRNIQRMFALAKQASLKSDYRHYKIGAVIFCGKKILAVDCNLCKGLPLQRQYNPKRGFEDDRCQHFGHAEMRAIHSFMKKKRKIDFNMSKVSICIYREHKNGHYALAKPCPACEAALRALGINNIYYTGENSLVYEYYE